MQAVTNELVFRRAAVADMRRYFNWANDSDARASSFSHELIDWDEHEKWFTGKVDSPETLMLIFEQYGKAVGQVRFERQIKDVTIDYSIDTELRGTGLSKKMVELAIRECDRRFDLPFRAEVKKENTRSIAVFKRLGFSEDTENSQSDRVIFLSEL